MKDLPKEPSKCREIADKLLGSGPNFVPHGVQLSTNNNIE